MGRVAYNIVRAFLAQSVERAAFNRKVVGSRPTGGVFFQSSRKKKGHMSGRKKSQRKLPPVQLFLTKLNFHSTILSAEKQKL